MRSQIHTQSQMNQAKKNQEIYHKLMGSIEVADGKTNKPENEFEDDFED